MNKQSAFPLIVMAADGFHFEGNDEMRVEWSAIRRITTRKLDLVTTDEIRLIFEHDGSPLSFEVSEEQPGFEQFRRFVEERFKFPRNWWESL